MASHIYHNIVIDNKNSNSLIEARYSEVRGAPIIVNPDNYKVSIVRCVIGSQNDIPIFLFKPVPQSLGNPSPDVGNYSITLEYDGEIISENLIYNQTYNSAVVPHNWNGINLNNWKYYSVYSYQQMLDMINACFQSLINRMNTLKPLNPNFSIGGGYAPFMKLDVSSGNISLFAAREFSDAYVGAPVIKIWFSFSLYSFFAGALQYETLRGYGHDDKRDVLLKINDRGNNAVQIAQPVINYPPYQNALTYSIGQLVYYNGVNYRCIAPTTGSPPPSAAWAVKALVVFESWDNTTVYTTASRGYIYEGIHYRSIQNGNVGNVPPASPLWWVEDKQLITYEIKQDYPTLYRWSDISNILVISNSISCRNESIPTVAVSGNQAQGVQSSGALILTDFNVFTDTGPDTQGNIVYTPTAEYRWTDMLGNTALQSIDITVNWQTKDGLILPLSLNPFGGFVSLKFLFQKK